MSDAARICDLPLDEFIAGPGGFTSWTDSGGAEVVSLDTYQWASDFAYCALERLERALREAERRGISRETMEEAMRHAPDA